MTKRDWAILGCRILALYLFVQAGGRAADLLTAITGLVTGTQSPWHSPRYTWWGYLMSYGLISAILAVLGFVLWRSASLIAPWAVGEGSPGEPTVAGGASGAVGRDGLMEVALVVLGMYLVATRGSRILLYIIQEVSFAGGAGTWAPDYEAFVPTLVVFGVGVWLVLEAGRTVSFISRFRPEGASKPPRPAPYGRISLVATAVIAVCLVVVAVVYYIWAVRHYQPMPF